MSGTKFTIIDAQVQAMLSGMATRAGSLSPGMKIIAALVLASVQRNFETGGRPSKWAALKPSTLRNRKSGGGPLVVKGFGGGLLGSVHAESDATTATVGTDKIYGAVHQFGAKKGSFGSFLTKGGKSRALPWGDIPARPFLMLQQEDREAIPDVLAKFVLGASGGRAR